MSKRWPSRQQNWGVMRRTTQYWDKMDCLNAVKKDCLRGWKETKSLVMWRQLKKSAKISGVEFGKRKWSTMQRLNASLQDFKNELDALGRQGEVKVSAPMIKKQLRKIVQLEICGSRWYAWLLAEKVYRVTCLRSVLEWLTNGRTVLVVKHKGREVNCLTSDQLHAYLYNWWGSYLQQGCWWTQ